MASADNNDHGTATSVSGTSVSNSDANGREDALVPVEYQNGEMSEMGWPMAYPVKPEILDAAPTLMTMWAALRRRWALALGLGIMLSVAGMLLTMFFVPIEYTAVARLRVSQKAESILPTNGPRTDHTKEWPAYRETQRALVKSQFVLLAALRKNDLMQMAMIREQGNDYIAWLQENFKARFTSPESEILDLKISYRDAEEAKRMVNAVQAAYLREVVDAERSKQLNNREKLKAALSRKNANLHTNRVDLDNLMKEHGDPDGPAAQARMATFIQQIKQYTLQKAPPQSMLFELRFKRRGIIQANIEGTWPPPLDQALVGYYVGANQEVQFLNNLLFQYRQIHADESLKSKDPNSRALRLLLEQIVATEDNLAETRARVQIEIEQQLRQQQGNYDSAADAIEAIDKQISPLLDSIKEIDIQIAQASTMLQGMRANAVAIKQKEQEVEQLEEMTRTMDRQMQLLDLSVDSPPRVIKLEGAYVPDQAGSWFFKVAITVLVGIIGFVLGTGGVSFAEFQARRVGSSEDISQGLGQTVVGTLPSLSGGLLHRGAGPHLQAMLADSIDSIRATLIHNTSADSMRVVMITSPLDREGKTTLASQLAASLARGGQRTVLVDADVRNPSCHQWFDLNCDPGMSEVLREEAEVDDVVRATRIANLWLVPAGRYNSESVQALARPIAADLFDQLRGKFDFVVIDAGAVLTVADALLIGQHVDGAVLSVLRDVSRTPDVYQAAERLKSVGINLMGTVVSGEDNRSQKRMYRRQLASPVESQPAESNPIESNPGESNA